MNLICAVCPGCLTKLELAPDDQCPTHRLHELREEKPTVGFNCDHHENVARTKPPIPVRTYPVNEPPRQQRQKWKMR